MHWEPSAGTLVCSPAALPHLPVIGSQHPIPCLPDDSCPTPSRLVAPRCDALEGDFAQVTYPLSSSSWEEGGQWTSPVCPVCSQALLEGLYLSLKHTPAMRDSVSLLPTLLNLVSVCHLWPMESTLYS